MTFPRKIILMAAVALAISLGTACSFFDAAPAVNHQTAKPTATGEATNSALPPENGAANNAVATQPRPSKQTMPDDQRWCQAWALDNLKPHVYAEFVNLDPERMDDLDRTVWRSRLPEVSLRKQTITSQLCWMYWAEPLSKANADQRIKSTRQNASEICCNTLTRNGTSLPSTAVRYDETPAYKIPNQYVQVLKWLDTPGQELLEMDNPPYELFKRMYNEEYTQNPNMPTTDQTARLADMYSEACQFYYPQLFYGYWIPSATWPNESPSQLSKVEVAKIKRTQEGPLYLPRP